MLYVKELVLFNTLWDLLKDCNGVENRGELDRIIAISYINNFIYSGSEHKWVTLFIQKE